MTLRSKTKRRLTALAICFLALLVVLGGLYFVRKQRLAVEARHNREAGMAYAKSGKYADAVEKLSKYLRRVPDDPEALYTFALAQEKVELPQGGHIINSIRILSHLLEVQPDNADAQHELLKLYTMVGFGKEAIDLADRVLKREPKNVEALRDKAVALFRTNKVNDALKYAELGAQADPGDPRTQFLVLQIQKRLDQPRDRVIGRAKALLKAHPDDPRMMMLVGLAYDLYQDRPSAADAFKKALAAKPMSNPKDVTMLAMGMEDAELYPDALKVLDDGAKRLNDPDLLKLVVQRLWQVGRDKDVVEHLKNIDATDAEVSSDLVAYKAMSLLRLKQKDQATALVDALDKRPIDARAHAWVPFLRDIVMGEQKDPTKVIEVCKQALTASPDNACVLFFLGEAYSQIGENELAIKQWQQAARFATSWATPWVRISQVESATNRGPAALVAARMAMVRSPNNINSAVAWATALDEVASSPGVKNREQIGKELLKVLAEIQKAAPAEPRTVAMYADLLASQGKKPQATDVIKSAIADPAKAPPEVVLNRLAAVSRKWNLGLDQQCLSLSQKSHGLTPTLALSHAGEMVQKGNTPGALEYLQKTLEKNSAKDPLQWKLAWARLLDAVNDPRAKGIWESLGEEQAKNLAVQRMVLDVRAVQRDRDFMDKTIDRVKQLSGDDAITWRIARAKWLLGSDNPDRDASKAAVMLSDIVQTSPDLVQPRLLLAAAQERVQNYSAAVEQLAAAARLQPENLNVWAELARMRVLIGDLENARAALDKVLAAKSVPAALRAPVASTLVQIGELDKAIALLSDGGKPSLMLAELYLRKNERAKAEAMFKQLVAEPEVDPNTVRAYAHYLGASGRGDEAIQTLALLKKAKLEPGVMELILGDYDRQFLGQKEALEQYRSAVKLAKDNRVAWRTLVSYEFQVNKVDDAFKTIAEAQAALGDAPAMSILHDNEDVVRKAAAAAPLRPFVQAILQDRENRSVALDVIRMALDAEKNKQTVGATLVKLRQLADKNPRFAALQEYTIDVAVGAGQLDTAGDLATRAMRSFPTDPAPAEKLAHILQAQGKPNDALVVAKQWRQRSQTGTLAPDVAIAELHLASGDPQQALKQIEPYRAAALADPGHFFPVISVYTRALVAEGQDVKAATVLKPLLSQAAEWRSFWQAIATRMIRDPKVAASWLGRVEPVIPADATRERAVLATNYYGLGMRAKDASLRRHALDMLKALAEAAKPDPDVLVAYGQILYQEKQTEQAAEVYRQAIKLKPNEPVAMNNLAMIDAESGQNLPEALAMAKKAVELQPKAATFYDSLATVQMKMNQPDDAMASLKKAIEVDPGEATWKLNLADIQVRSGHRADALKIVQQIENSVADPGLLPKTVQDRIRKVRSGAVDRQPAVGAR